MVMGKYILIVCFALIISAFVCKKTKPKVTVKAYSIAFYNIDNLYDISNDTDHDDDEFTPNGNYKWTKKRYQNKLNNMAKVISQIANGNAPDILGVCELESATALKDLLNTGNLKNNYQFAHFDSPDERGVDVALIFNQQKFSLLESKPLFVSLSKDSTDRTRDILYTKLLAKDAKDTLHFLVCHFPSRREGKYQSEQNRIDAAKVMKKFVSENVNLKTQNLIIMGDFNDEPWDKSVYKTMGAQNYFKTKDSALLNLMWGFEKEKRGSYKFKNEINILDQIIISKALANNVGVEYEEGSVNIFDKEWLKQKGKYEGYPLRTFGGKEWLNGYSDHYAVYMQIKY